MSELVKTGTGYGLKCGLIVYAVPTGVAKRIKSLQSRIKELEQFAADCYSRGFSGGFDTAMNADQPEKARKGDE